MNSKTTVFFLALGLFQTAKADYGDTCQEAKEQARAEYREDQREFRKYASTIYPLIVQLAHQKWREFKNLDKGLYREKGDPKNAYSLARGEFQEEPKASATLAVKVHSNVYINPKINTDQYYLTACAWASRKFHDGLTNQDEMRFCVYMDLKNGKIVYGNNWESAYTLRDRYVSWSPPQGSKEVVSIPHVATKAFGRRPYLTQSLQEYVEERTFENCLNLQPIGAIDTQRGLGKTLVPGSSEHQEIAANIKSK